MEQSSAIFAFEGRFVVCKEGQVTYIMRDDSALPDTKKNVVIKDGIYSVIYWKHHGQYAALQLRVNGTIDIIENEDLKERMQENLDVRGAGADENDIPAIRYQESPGQP